MLLSRFASRSLQEPLMQYPTLPPETYLHLVDHLERFGGPLLVNRRSLVKELKPPLKPRHVHSRLSRPPLVV